MTVTGDRRRRADDWKDTSGVRADPVWLTEIALSLGYKPTEVMSVRLNRGEAVVTYRDNGLPRCVRHIVEGR